MINLVRNTANTIVVDAPLTLSTAYILLWFYSPDTGRSVYCVAPDVNTARYVQELTVTESGSSDPDPLAGEVQLMPRGEWRLRVYEQEDDDNLDPEEATRMLFDDRCMVMGNAEEDIEYTGTAIICDPATVTNSDSTYEQDIASGSTFVLPDLTHTNSDGSPVVLPGQTPFVATLCGAPVQDDFYYAIAIGHP